jgi:hypothetical protein
MGMEKKGGDTLKKQNRNCSGAPGGHTAAWGGQSMPEQNVTVGPSGPGNQTACC